MSDTEARLLCLLEPCTVLGGCGYNLIEGRDTRVKFQTDAIGIDGEACETAQTITYPEIVGIQIEGPGAVSRGGGFIGGGFGFEGALEGIAVASILNMLTTNTKIHTFMQIVSDTGEVFLHYAGLEPGALRIALSPVFAY